MPCRAGRSKRRVHCAASCHITPEVFPPAAGSSLDLGFYVWYFCYWCRLAPHWGVRVSSPSSNIYAPRCVCADAIKVEVGEGHGTLNEGESDLIASFSSRFHPIHTYFNGETIRYLQSRRSRQRERERGERARDRGKNRRCTCRCGYVCRHSSRVYMYVRAGNS